MTIDGVKVENVMYVNDKFLCPNCAREVDIYDESISYYYTKCECGTLVENKNLMEARSE